MIKILKENWLIILSVIYVFSPIDIVPDFLAGFGLIDDAGVLITTIVLEVIKRTRAEKKS